VVEACHKSDLKQANLKQEEVDSRELLGEHPSYMDLEEVDNRIITAHNNPLVEVNNIRLNKVEVVDGYSLQLLDEDDDDRHLHYNDDLHHQHGFQFHYYCHLIIQCPPSFTLRG
jgi:hypothetical protein